MKHLLPAGYLLLQRGTYDLTEGHMVHFVSYDIKFLFPQCMEAVIIIAIQNDDQEEEKMISHSSVDMKYIPSASYESLLLKVKLYEDFYGYFGFYFNIFEVYASL